MDAQALITIFISLISFVVGVKIGKNFQEKDTNVTKLVEIDNNTISLDVKKILVESLLKELHMIKDALLIGLSPTADLTGIPRLWLPRRLSTNIFNSAINSGHFILLSPNNQASLISFYEDVKHLNTLGSNAGAMHFQELHTRSVDSMTATIEKLLLSFDDVIFQLEIENV